MSLAVFLPLGAGVLVVGALILSAGRSAPRFARRRLQTTARSARPWIVDVVVGWLLGSAVGAIIGGSVLATNGWGSTALSRTVFAIAGSVLGIAFMRLVRVREAERKRARPPEVN
jgi:hypothetical protein